MSVQNSRTVAVLPTSQTTSVASIHGSSSTSSGSTVTALVPPQQVHSASGGMAGEVMSTTSSHTDYMPATSSAASIVVAAVSPMGKFKLDFSATSRSPLFMLTHEFPFRLGANIDKSDPTQSIASNSSENMQEAESVEDSSSSSSSTQVTVQQAVALVSPRQHENAPQNIVAPQQMVDQLHAASMCASASSSTSTGNQSQSITMSTHNRATSTSNTVTTSQAGHKRPRDNETDSTEDISSDHGQKKPQVKRTRTQIGSSTSQGVSESSCLDVDYQVHTINSCSKLFEKKNCKTIDIFDAFPACFCLICFIIHKVTTSSQRDQDDESLVIVDSESDEEMPDDGPVEPDDAIQFEDEADNVETFEEEVQGNAYCAR